MPTDRWLKSKAGKDKWGTDSYEDIIERFSKEFGNGPLKSEFNGEKVTFNDFSNSTPYGTWRITKDQQTNLWDLGNSADKEKVAEDSAKKDLSQSPTVDLKASSTIQSASYWPDREYLVVSFKSGHTYDYRGVPVQTVASWENAASAGSYFYYNIRTSYPYRKLG